MDQNNTNNNSNEEIKEPKTFTIAIHFLED